MVLSTNSKEIGDSSLGFASLGQMQEFAIESSISSSVSSSKRLASLAFFAICKSPIIGEELTVQVSGENFDDSMVRPTLINLDIIDDVLKNDPGLAICTSGFGPSSFSFLENFVADRREVIDTIDRQLA